MTIVELSNLALLNIGISHTIAAVDESTREAKTITRFYDHTLRICLRRFPWSFATKYLPLDLVAGPVWDDDPDELTRVQAWQSSYQYREGDVVRNDSVNYWCILDHTNQEPPNATYWSTDADDRPQFANGDWMYTYAQPTDCVYARRIVPPGGYGREHNDTPILFRRFRNENGLLIATHEPDAILEYTMVDCVDMWTDDLFLQYFAWALAGKLCPSLERAQKTVLECHQFAEAAFRLAATADINEAQPAKPAEAGMIRAR